MLPTLGLFRVCPCPYYVVGLCERPHCCFRHCRSDVEAARRESASLETEDAFDSDHEGTTTAEANGKQKISDVVKADDGHVKRQSSVVVEENRQKSTEVSPTNTASDSRIGLKRLADHDDDARAERLVKRAKTDERSGSESTVAEVGKKSGGSDSDIEVVEVGPDNAGNSHKKRSKTDEDKHKSKSKDSSSSGSTGKKHKSDEHKSHNSKHKHHKDSHRSRSSSHSSSHRSSSISSSKHKDSHSTKKSHEEKRHSSHSHKHKASTSSSAMSSKDSVTEITKSDSFTINIEAETSESPAVTSTTDDNPVFSMTIDEDASVPDDFLYPSDEEDDPEQIALECYKLFQDYKSDDSGVECLKLETLPEPKNTATGEPEAESSGYGKKRLAHPGALKPLVDKTAPLKRKESAREQLLRRMQPGRDENIGSTPSVSFPSSSSSSHSTSSPTPVPASAVSPTKRRIAHVSNATALMKPLVRSDSTPVGNGESKVDSSSQRNSGSSYVTLSQTVAKGEKRLAHAPKVIDKGAAGSAPKIVPDLRSKVPTVVRQKFLEQIYREFLQLCPDSAAASCKAVEEEKTLLAKCNTKQVYSCSAANLIAKLRKQYRESAADSSGATLCGNKVVSHSDILAGKAGGAVSWSIEKKVSTVPVGAQLYQRLTDYLMSSTELIQNGYPRKCPNTFKGCSGLAVIKPREDCTYSRVIEESPRKTCDRCGISYLVNEDGFPVKEELCTYHSGRRWGRRTRTGNAETRYNCCDGELNSTGCCTASCHVFSGKSPEDLKNFICAALEPGDPGAMGTNPWDIIGVDCEMIYTTRGSQLARATFVDVNGKILYDTLVKPPNPVLDYNTRFSGIDESMLKDTKISMKEVHLKILANLRPNSIIVGHSLENDLIALKLIHGCVVDTSVVFPHKRGPPFKRALRNLSAECLGKIIQTGEGGHDSAEDARAALDLMLWKVKNDNGKANSRKTVSSD